MRAGSGENLKAMLRSATHHVEHALDVFERDVLVKQVAHRVDEDGLRLSPPQR
jgi:hypothetical protein